MPESFQDLVTRSIKTVSWILRLNSLAIIPFLISLCLMFGLVGRLQLQPHTETAYRAGEAVADVDPFLDYQRGWRDKHVYGWPFPIVTLLPVGESTPTYKIKFHPLSTLLAFVGWGIPIFLFNYSLCSIFYSWRAKDFRISFINLFGIVVGVAVCLAVPKSFVLLVVSIFVPNAKEASVLGIFTIYLYLFFVIWSIFLFASSKRTTMQEPRKAT